MKKITPRDLALGIIFVSQIMTGILGNFSLLYQYLFIYHTGCRMRAMDLICKHPTIANFLVIFSKGVPQAIVAFGLKHVFSDFARKTTTTLSKILTYIISSVVIKLHVKPLSRFKTI